MIMGRTNWSLMIVAWIVASASLIASLLLMPGCGALDLGDLQTIAYKDGPGIATCAPQEYSAVKEAIQNGSTDVGGAIFDWVAAVGMFAHCVEPVALDLYKAYKGTPITASRLRSTMFHDAYLETAPTLVAGPIKTPRAIPRPVARRLYHALWQCRAAGICKN